eukprot:TRINITY_DN9808_c0_g1_i1.p1 TRINITY_DN9808_c0_g1~~TRINITY_DN9808_c0_g1_i1.p1  ORF type:complete len:240 (+),score=68.86 TRINITY_DN9808_c0_g1_i1:364-1083(+)
MGDFERLNSLVSEVADDIAQRKRLNPTNPAHQQQHSKLSATIQRKLKQLEAEISMRDEELRSGKSRNQRDYHQKSGMLAVLSLRREELQEEFVKDGGTISTEDNGNQGVISQLFGQKKSQAQQQAAANREQLMSMDVESLKEKKERLFQEQDKGFDVLSETVGRQMEVAKSIGKEVSRHHVILDSLESKVGDTDNRVRRETLRVVEFTEDTSSLCPYYCFIIILIVVLIVLLSLPQDLI